MSDVIKAALWMSGAIGSFSAMAIAGRAVSFELDTFEIMMFRSFVGIVLVLSIAGAAGTLWQITRRNLGLQAIRNLCHFTGQNLWFFALTMIPLAQLFALEFTSPLWVLLLSPLFLGERLTRPKVLAALVGFTGVLIVVRPDFNALNIGVICAAASAIFFAGTAIATRKLTRTETITCILFYLTVMQAVFGIIAAGYDGDIALPSAVSVPWLILIGCAGLLAHFCLTTALSLAPASVVMPIDFIRLPVIAVIGAAFYSEAIDLWIFIGAALIFGANYANIRLENRRVTRM
ncbi:DMT family transporter [Cognatishimia sp. MH4019]|uniref:DMT family transporter n=1 Tax=Cognatishimia sp. MH4019 TaxID=2854030 RepID=UPI001CD79928|nr:DMT family transporter [Cognatishimia sp. MH4019]